jgi:hypothetical protein
VAELRDFLPQRRDGQVVHCKMLGIIANNQ